MFRDGRYFGHIARLSLKMSRAKIVCEKIIQGLLYDSFGLLLPPGYAIQMWVNITDELSSELTEIMPRKNRRARRLGEGVFTYSAAQAVEDPAQTIWLCAFYDIFYFCAATMPAGLLSEFERRFNTT